MVDRFKAYQHPRVPVYCMHRDNMVGFVHAEDVLRVVLDQVDLTKLKPEDIMHPPVVVPLTKKVDEMFDFFQDRNARAALVLNEFGGVEGLVTMKDVLTFIFGQISGRVIGEEHYRERDENVYEVPGDMKLTDFNNLTNFGIEDPRMTTIGGVAFRYLDRLPKVGDKVAVEGIRIAVLEMDEHRIARVRVSQATAAEQAEGATQAPDEGETPPEKAAGAGVDEPPPVLVPEEAAPAGVAPAQRPSRKRAQGADKPAADGVEIKAKVD
jgi:CBS domain containing-hemolysin-like protein